MGSIHEFIAMLCPIENGDKNAKPYHYTNIKSLFILFYYANTGYV
ncbi:hypothetical protein Xszus_02180 [Xenorhabdus szentirmaii]|nr:hypothetical protein Xsze_00092 [Xenorhabdus szentirmaii DSM 16338]PHM42445.1 hypothetical protein Xszus_02180 [Xenorhabdus szentirmaii]